MTDRARVRQPGRACRRWPSTIIGGVLAFVALMSGPVPARADEPAGAPRDPSGRIPRQGQAVRLRCLYNGYLLTVDPGKAQSPASTADRYRLYVLHAVLVHPDTGRVAAIFPALGTPAFPDGEVARPVSDFPLLLSSESPPAPGITAEQLRTYWRTAGVAEELLGEAQWLDLDGAVATPGLVDTHFHVSSWSKKVPAPGERFGYWADVSDPAYYVLPGDWERTCARDAMWRIVADANRHLVESGDDGIFLHGYIYPEIDSDASGALQAAYLYASTSSASGTFNPYYLPNRIGAQAVTPPADPCTTDPASWPALDYPTATALVVQTTGQSCWFNSALLAAYNERQESIRSSLEPIAVTAVAPSGSPDGETWILSLPAAGGDADVLFRAALPFSVDVVTAIADDGDTLWVPFDVIASDAAGRTLTGQAMIPELASQAFAEPPVSLELRPFARFLVEWIPATVWDAAADYWGTPPSHDPVSYGAWDPRDPDATNWYNGAKRGLIQYFYDSAADGWRPTGYAEHYPMRDALGAVVVSWPTIPELVEQRRNTAAWCHRHGLTMVNDIMFYRRDGEDEFDAYEAMSWDHGPDAAFLERVGLDPGASTGGLDLRVGLYYYVETGDDVAGSLGLALDEVAGSDVERLRPPTTHYEYPGWVRWLGWKLQLDGSSMTRNSFTSAPLAKYTRTDPLPVANELGNQVTFQDHSFGLLTMTDLQEQVLSSRESAALYWLVRESDPTSPFYNPNLANDWSGLTSGVVNFLGFTVTTQLLAADLGRLNHVSLSPDQAVQLADKLAAVFAQVNDAWERTLSALIRIWFEASRSPADLPPLPSQVVCHTSGDGAVDLWARAIQQLKQDVESLPTEWAELPQRWKEVVPEDADLGAIRRSFSDERFRIEHLLFISGHLLDILQGADGIDAASTPSTRNALVSLQPSIMALDGGTGSAFPVAQELWILPGGVTDPWQGLPPVPRYHHTDALTTFVERDIPMTINTDPPAMRDPRPVLTVIGAVARTPVEIDPTQWADQEGPEPASRPPDYLAGKVYAPFGYLEGSDANPMQITIEQALAAMTYWGAYSARMENEVGAIAIPSDPEQLGWLADIVVWRANPLAITGPDSLTLDALGRMPSGTDDADRLATVNAYITGFLPRLTVVGGVPVFSAD